MKLNSCFMRKYNYILSVLVIAFFFLGVIHYRTPFWVPQGGPWSVGFGHSKTFPKHFPQAGDGLLTITDLHTQIPNAQFIADPFWCQEGDTLWVFVELKIKQVPKASIGVFASIDGEHFLYQGVVLEESFHLSYPQVFKHQKRWYMIPETAQSNQVLLYEATDFPRKWRVCDTLVTKRKLKDPTLYLSDTLNFIMASDDDLNLHAFTADSLRGNWTDQGIIRSGSEARPGGRIFCESQTIYLPLQNAQKGYGSGLSLYRIDYRAKKLHIHKEKHLWLQAQKDVPVFSHGMHHLDMQKTAQGWRYVYDGNTKSKLPKKNQWKFALKATYKDLMN
jgi:hypothetical protein